MKTKKEIADTIIYYLIDNNMSVTELAKQLNISRVTIYNWMNGKTIMNDRYYIQMLKMFEDYDASKWVINKDERQLEEYMFKD